MEKLQKIAASMREAALNAGVQLVTGDTKVVDRGKGDGVFINTSGIGVIEHSLQIHPGSIRPGDQILLSGDIGRHGIAVMASREGLEFKTSLKSDCAPMWNPVKALLEGGQEIHCLRDLTRGGLAGALNEIAQVCQMEILIHEGKIPVQEEVRGACEILGLNPFYAANEGRMIVFVPEPEAESALSLLKAQENSSGARWIGEVKQGRPGQVTAATALGTKRILEQISGEQLPRIC